MDPAQPPLPNQPAQGFSAGIHQNVWDFADLALKTRFARALEEGISRYPIKRTLRLAARAELEELFDDLALNLGWRAQRLDGGVMILDTDGLFVSAYGGRKSDYCSLYFAVWADTPERAVKAQERILERVGSAKIEEPMFSVDWHFLTAKGELQSAVIEEMADDVLHDHAYPDLGGPVVEFIERYLAAPETVLVLQGSPGTGKTRLIRAILGAMSRQKRGQAQALYTGDMKALETDEIFVKFITGWEDAFVVEDADHLLKPRAEGNENLHRFLTIADGVVRAQGRKIIFSTNLPNIGDLDDALIRPGRCFARVTMRNLTARETATLVTQLSAGDAHKAQSARATLGDDDSKTYSLAQIYQALGRAS